MRHKLADEQKNCRIDRCRYMIEKFNGEKKNMVKKHGCTTTTPKRSDNRSYGALKMNQHQQNITMSESDRNKCGSERNSNSRDNASDITTEFHRWRHRAAARHRDVHFRRVWRRRPA
ncbi:hypothetical protein EVAR_21046_1 [Eumeta japonica]|uniref:Uncharacterized protein n=1 Tax=Eumeta variegata TaxID=151549 RepID=A0A4C1UZT1_EUMVA|nr:hypothetical protein EVAR_21046_1 [Eumeta japonica]